MDLIFQMKQVVCDQKGHENQQISSICCRSQCTAKSACCQKCVVKLHSACLKQIIFFDAVPKQIVNIQNVEKLCEGLISRVISILKEVKSNLTNILLPIKQYKDNSNLENLNRLGDLLRYDPTQSFGQAEKAISMEVNKLHQSFEQFLLKPKNDDSQKQKVDAEQSQKQQVEAEQQFQEYKRLQNIDSKLAVICIEKATKLDPNNDQYWYQQGLFLNSQGRYEDSLISLTKSIEIKPSVDAYVFKGFLLSFLNRNLEAIECLQQGLRDFPKDRRIISLFISTTQSE